MANEAPREKLLTCALYGDALQCPASAGPPPKEAENCYSCAKWAAPTPQNTTLAHDLTMLIKHHGNDKDKGASASALAEHMIRSLDNFPGGGTTPNSGGKT